MANIELINKIFVLFIVLFSYLIFFKFSKDISKLKDVKKSKKTICASTLILINLIFSYFFNESSICYILIISNLISCFIYLKVIYKNSLIEDIVLTFTYRITDIVCTCIIYASIYQLDKYIKLPWWILEYVPGILSVIFVYLFATKVDEKLMDFKEFKLKIKEFYFLLLFCLSFLIGDLIFSDHSLSGFIAIYISIICLTSNVALFYYKDEKQKKIMAEKEALIAKQEALIAEKEAAVAEKEAAMSEKKAFVSERKELVSNIGKLLCENAVISMQKEKNEEEFAAEKKSLLSQIADLLSENEELMFKIEGLMFENKNIFKHHEQVKREIINILKDNIKPVLEDNLVLQKENLKSIIEENLTLHQESIKYRFELQNMEIYKSRNQQLNENFKNFLDYLLSCEDIDVIKSKVDDMKKCL